MALRVALTRRSFTLLSKIDFLCQSVFKHRLVCTQTSLMVLELLGCLAQVRTDNVSTHDVSITCGFNIGVLRDSLGKPHYRRLFRRPPGMIELCVKLSIQIRLLVGGVGRGG